MNSTTFTVGYPMTIGLTGGRVTVCATSNGYELESVDQVLTDDGLDILPYLDWHAYQDIQSYYERHSEPINAAQKDPYD